MSDEDKLQPLERALYELMSAVSEECYCAGWLDGTEYAVWDLCRGIRETWGQGPTGHAKALLGAIATLSELIDRWIVWVDDDEDHDNWGPRAVTLNEFRAIYAPSLPGDTR